MEPQVLVEHRVHFIISPPETFVARATGRITRYVKVDSVVVNLYSSDRSPEIRAYGYRCKKDGTPGASWGKQLLSVELAPSINRYWIECAEVEIAGQVWRRMAAT